MIMSGHAKSCQINSPHFQNPPACPSSILLLDRGKFAAAAFNVMLVDCCVRWVLIWAWQQQWTVDARPSIGMIVCEKLHYFNISHEKSAKIKNRRSSRHVLLKSTWRSNRRFVSWRIIITDIQSGNIGGLVGRNQSLPKFAVFALDSSHFSSPTLWGVFPLDSENPGQELWGTPPNNALNGGHWIKIGSLEPEISSLSSSLQTETIVLDGDPFYLQRFWITELSHNCQFQNSVMCITSNS